MPDPLRSHLSQLSDTGLPEDPGAAIAYVVEAQKSVVQGWVRYATRSLDRLQTGDFEPGGWSRDLSSVIRETSAGTVRALGALARLRVDR